MKTSQISNIPYVNLIDKNILDVLEIEKHCGLHCYEAIQYNGDIYYTTLSKNQIIIIKVGDLIENDFFVDINKPIVDRIVYQYLGVFVDIPKTFQKVVSCNTIIHLPNVYDFLFSVGVNVNQFKYQIYK